MRNLCVFVAENTVMPIFPNHKLITERRNDAELAGPVLSGLGQTWQRFWV